MVYGEKMEDIKLARDGNIGFIKLRYDGVKCLLCGEKLLVGKMYIVFRKGPRDFIGGYTSNSSNFYRTDSGTGKSEAALKYMDYFKYMALKPDKVQLFDEAGPQAPSYYKLNENERYNSSDVYLHLDCLHEINLLASKKIDRDELMIENL
jgi:hypothetical protein